MRVLLITGKGGVGKTSIAAATAHRLASGGRRTLVLSTDPAHSLADVLDHRVGATPTPIAANLEAEQLDARQRLVSHWDEVRTYLATVLEWGGVDAVEAEELAVLPGLEELFALLDVQRHVDADRHDALVVDCAPTAETLRLLALPEALGWYLERGFGPEWSVVRSLVERVTAVPVPGDEVVRAVDRLQRRLRRVRATLLHGGQTTVRLVTNAERVVVAETRRTHTALHLFGYTVDAVIVNRLLPDAIADPWFATWKQRQAAHLAEVRDGFVGVPIVTAPLFDDELVGGHQLDRLADSVYGTRDPADVLSEEVPLSFSRAGAVTRMRLALPFAERGDVDVHASAEELLVTVGSRTRRVTLPDFLVGAAIGGARVHQEALEVDFHQKGGGAAIEAVAGGAT